MLALGGFNLTKWMLASRNILEQLCEFGLAKPTVELNFDELPIEKTLDVLWASNSEALSCSIRIFLNRFESNWKIEHLLISFDETI